MPKSTAAIIAELVPITERCIDHTAPRIMAYLASVRPLSGVSNVHADACYQRGRSAIERLAMSATDDSEPTLRLSATDCADILHFMDFSEPRHPRTWWQDPEDSPSHVVGFTMVLRAMESAMRRVAGRKR